MKMIHSVGKSESLRQRVDRWCSRLPDAMTALMVLFAIAVMGAAGCSGSDDRSGSNGPDTNVRSVAIHREMPESEGPVYLYFGDRNRPFLMTEERVVPRYEDPVMFGRVIIEALIQGPTQGLRRTVSADTRLRALYLTPDKTAYVDLSREISDGHPGGSQSEYLAIYSIVNSLALNMAEIDQVKLLIDGQEQPTLAGHIDIRLPFKANMLIVR